MVGFCRIRLTLDRQIGILVQRWRGSALPGGLDLTTLVFSVLHEIVRRVHFDAISKIC